MLNLVNKTTYIPFCRFSASIAMDIPATARPNFDLPDSEAAVDRSLGGLNACGGIVCLFCALTWLFRAGLNLTESLLSASCLILI